MSRINSKIQNECIRFLWNYFWMKLIYLEYIIQTILLFKLNYEILLLK
jgi:hypothetical protein